MKSTEVINLIKKIFYKLFLFFFVKSILSNDNSNKAPPSYPVENSTMNNNPSIPDCHTADLVTYVKSLNSIK